MVTDPALVRNAAQNLRAEVIARVPVTQLDPVLVERIVAKVPIFQHISVAELKGIMAMGEVCRFMAGECIFNEGEAGTTFYVLVSGEVSVDKWHKDKNVPLATLSAGACFGEMALVSDEPRSATVRATSNTVALRFRRDALDASAGIALPIYRNIARVLARRLGQSSVMLADLASREEDRK